MNIIILYYNIMFTAKLGNYLQKPTQDFAAKVAEKWPQT